MYQDKENKVAVEFFYYILNNWLDITQVKIQAIAVWKVENKT